MPYMPFIWLGVIVLAVVIEALTSALVSIWFIPAAVLALILSLFEIGLGIQLAVFGVCAILLLVFAKVVFKKTLRIKSVATNADSVIGEKAVVTEAINNLEGRGQAKVRGQIWSARAADNDTKYDVDEVLDVVAIEGVKLICRK